MAKIKGVAYPSDDDCADLFTGKGEGQPVAKEQKKVTSVMKVTVVMFKEMVRGAYGAFNPGEVAEIDAKLAADFIEAGICEKYSAPAHTDEEED